MEVLEVLNIFQMLGSSSENTFLNSQIRKASITIELNRVKVLINFLTVGLLVMFVNFFLIKDGSAFFKHSYTKFEVLG